MFLSKDFILWVMSWPFEILILYVYELKFYMSNNSINGIIWIENIKIYVIIFMNITLFDLSCCKSLIERICFSQSQMPTTVLALLSKNIIRIIRWML